MSLSGCCGSMIDRNFKSFMREKIIKKKCEKKHFKWDDELNNIKFLEFCKIVIRSWIPTQYSFLRIRIFGLKFVWSVFNDWFFFSEILWMRISWINIHIFSYANNWLFAKCQSLENESVSILKSIALYVHFTCENFYLIGF